MLGQSPIFLRTIRLIERIARAEAPVLIEGETGTGKELAARAIHYHSPRREGPFVPLNCGAVPEALVESELFGCERGAYTDARQARSGLVKSAEGGTLFLDELDSLPGRAQVALLRFLQDYRYRPVGGQRECLGDVRIVAAASPRLRQMLRQGQFRDDLAFRLGVFPVEMPPLRHREGDAQLLAEHFITRHAKRHGVAPRRLDEGSVRWMLQHDWPGNVRELDNRIQQGLLLADADGRRDGAMSLGDEGSSACGSGWAPWLDDSMTDSVRDAVGSTEAGPKAPLRSDGPLRSFGDARDEALLHFERTYLERLMQLTAGNVTRAARLAGKERRCLGKLLKKHGLGHGSSPGPMDLSASAASRTPGP